MHFVNNMYQHAQGYYNEIPQNTFHAMAYSFGAIFIMRSITRNDPKAGLIAGILSATASAIYGLVTPLFKKMIGHNPLSWGEEMCRTCSAIIATGCIAAAFGDRNILQNLFTYAVIYGFITYLEPGRCDLNSTDWMIAVPMNVPITAYYECSNNSLKRF